MTLSQTKLSHAATRLIYLGAPIFFLKDSESAQQREDDPLGGCEVSGRGSGRQRKSLQEVRGVRALGHCTVQNRVAGATCLTDPV